MNPLEESYVYQPVDFVSLQNDKLFVTYANDVTFGEFIKFNLVISAEFTVLP